MLEIFAEHLSMEPVHEIGTTHKIKLVIKFCIFCAVTTVVWLMFMLPVVFYHLPQEVIVIIVITNFCIKQLLFLRMSLLLICQLQIMAHSLEMHLSTVPRDSLSVPKTGLCSPVCGEWEEFPHDVVVAFDIITALLYILHLIGIAIALAFSCYNRKIM